MNKITKFFVGAIAALALSFGLVTATHAAYVHTGLLKQGMTSSQVKVLQETLNANGFLVSTVGAGSPGMESMYFGSKTKAAVMAFQTAKGLKADGIVGLQTGTALAALTGGSVTYPAGCMSTSGFSTTTGLPCSSSANFPAGCTSNSGFSTTTGQSCAGSTTLPAGCTSTAGYSPTTGQACNGGSSNNGPLQGGAGTLNAVNTSADVKTNLNQGDTAQKVVAARVTAQGSDISISSANVAFTLSSGTSASDRIDRYVGNVTVWLDGTQVGSANISQFYRDGSPYNYTYSIPLSNAVVRQNQSANLYVAVDVNPVIAGSTSSGDLSAHIKASINSLRYSDPTGAILSMNPSSVSGTFQFNSTGSSANASLALSSSNPVAATVQVNKTNTSSSYKLLSATLKNDSSATSSVTINRIPVTLTVASAGSAANTDNLINSVNVSINGTSYSANKSTSTSGTLTSGSGSADYIVDMNNNGISLNPGQSVTVDVYATFRSQTSNYSEGATVTASINAANIDASTSNADVTVGGNTVTGQAMSLRSTGASFSINGTPSTTVNNNSTTASASNATFTFNVTANPFDGNIYLPQAGANAVDYTFVNASTGATASTPTSASVSVTAPGANTQSVNGETTYILNSNQTFTITVVVDPAAAGQYYVKINDIKVYTDASATSTSTVNVPSASFQTSPVYIAG